MKTRLALIVPLLLLAGVSIASASPVEIGFGGGVSVPVSDTKDVLKSGWHGTGIVNLNMPMLPFGLSGSFSYHHFALDHPSGTLGMGGSGRILAGLANATFAIPIPGPIKPYLTAGIGAFNVKANPDSTTTPATAIKSTTKFGIDGGAGVKISIPGTRVHAFVEGKFENIYTDQGLNGSVVNNLKTQIVPVTFGIFL